MGYIKNLLAAFTALLFGLVFCWILKEFRDVCSARAESSRPLPSYHSQERPIVDCKIYKRTTVEIPSEGFVKQFVTQDSLPYEMKIDVDIGNGWYYTSMRVDGRERKFMWRKPRNGENATEILFELAQ